jgi:hypothetical protein
MGILHSLACNSSGFKEKWLQNPALWWVDWKVVLQIALGDRHFQPLPAAFSLLFRWQLQLD